MTRVLLGTALAALLLLPTGATAAPRPVGVDVIDPEFDGQLACRQAEGGPDRGFLIEPVDPADGTLGPGRRFRIAPEPIAVSGNGPEVARTPEGAYCAGTIAGGGIVVYNRGRRDRQANGLSAPLVPYRVTCPTPRYLARDAADRRRAFLFLDGALTDFAAIAPGTPTRWLGCGTVVVSRPAGLLDPGGLFAVDVPSGLEVRITERPLAAGFGFLAGGRRHVAASGGGTAYLFAETPGGAWEELLALPSPVAGYPSVSSVEGFERGGGPWLSGILARGGGGGSAPSLAFVYGVAARDLALFGEPGDGNVRRDAETLELPDGRLAVYYQSRDDGTVVVETIE